MVDGMIVNFGRESEGENGIETKEKLKKKIQSL